MRDESKKHDPCLVEFSELPEQERNQNLQVALDTLRCALLPVSYTRTNPAVYVMILTPLLNRVFTSN